MEGDGTMSVNLIGADSPEIRKELPVGDLDELSTDQIRILTDLILLAEMTQLDEAKAMKWLMEDKKFLGAFERRRAALLKLNGFSTDAKLVEAVKKGDAATIRLLYQREGIMPVGGEYVAPNRDGLDNLEKGKLEEMVTAILLKSHGKKK